MTTSTKIAFSSLDIPPYGVHLAPWGKPPTPLLPRWYRETLSELPLPDEVRRANSAVTTVGDLDTFWAQSKLAADRALLRALVKLVGRCRPPRNHIVIPAEIDHLELALFPLRPRTINVLHREGLFEGHSGLSVGELLSFADFGMTSLLDLMCVAELALTGRPPQYTLSESDHVDSQNPDWSTPAWSNAVNLLKKVLGAANEFYNVSTLGEALRLNLPKLAATIGIATDLESLRIQDLTNRYIGNTVTERLAILLLSMSSRRKLILEQRLFVSNPRTLQSLAEQIDVTRERVRQIEQQTLRTIDTAVGSEISTIATLLGEQIGPIITAVEFERLIVDVFNDGSSRTSAINLACRILKFRLDYSCVAGVCFNQVANDVVMTLRDVAGKFADDVGLIDEEALRDYLPSDEWNEFFPQLIERCAFKQVGDRIALRDSKRARVKELLIRIGRAATKEELAELCEYNTEQIGSHLSVIPSVVRIDKTRWGLADWTDDEYEGIVAEIIQQINENGGATPLERLLEELPRLFGVSENSIRSYVNTPQFSIQDGYVYLADETAITLRNLDDVVDGRNEFGYPYWTFVVKNRYFDGYSLVGFPPELARELGCGPNGKTFVLVNHPEGSNKLSVSWRLHSTTGATLGYLADPLKKLRVSGGDRVCMVIKGPGIIDLHRESTTTSINEQSKMSADLILERMKKRRGVT